MRHIPLAATTFLLLLLTGCSHAADEAMAKQARPFGSLEAITYPACRRSRNTEPRRSTRLARRSNSSSITPSFKLPHPLAS